MCLDGLLPHFHRCYVSSFMFCDRIGRWQPLFATSFASSFVVLGLLLQPSTSDMAGFLALRAVRSGHFDLYFGPDSEENSMCTKCCLFVTCKAMCPVCLALNIKLEAYSSNDSLSRPRWPCASIFQANLLVKSHGVQ